MHIAAQSSSRLRSVENFQAAVEEKSFRVMRLTVVSVIVLLLHLDISVVQSSSPFQLLRKFLETGGDRLRRELPDQKKLKSEYDFIIVGAGSAGCVLANRLSENPNWSVLLIEAGPSENYLMDIPMMVHYLQAYDINWAYKTEPSDKFCLGMKNNQCNWPRGKVMGGSSVLNYMIYTRGHPKDYDNWAALGNVGWDFKNVSHYFRKLENNVSPYITPNYHGKGGLMTISSNDFKSSSANAFVEAGREKGFPFIDYNGPQQIGFSYIQASIANGTRESTNVAYLYPIAGRKNLHVKKNTHVKKLIIDAGKTVCGVEFVSRGRAYTIRATKEVILSAGAINTPQILMLSGIGPSKHLKQLGIETIVNSAVGYNLMDHAAPGALTFIVNTTTLKSTELYDLETIARYTNDLEGPISSAGGAEAIAFIDSEKPGDPDGFADIELLFLGGSVNSDPALKRNFGLRDDLYEKVWGPLGTDTNTFMVYPIVLRPKSRGRLKLRSSNPFEYPAIFPNYYSDQHDIDVSIRGIRHAIALLDTEPYRKINAKLLRTPLPGCTTLKFDSDAYWECYTRHLTFTIYHYCGTAKMGPATDKRAVVDPYLRVYGVNKLRVVDASVMPEIITGHTNAPTIMIAEKAADLIKATWKLSS